MKSLKELETELEQLEKNIVLLKDQIKNHPDHKNNFVEFYKNYYFISNMLNNSIESFETFEDLPRIFLTDQNIETHGSSPWSGITFKLKNRNNLIYKLFVDCDGNNVLCYLNDKKYLCTYYLENYKILYIDKYLEKIYTNSETKELNLKTLKEICQEDIEIAICYLYEIYMEWIY